MAPTRSARGTNPSFTASKALLRVIRFRPQPRARGSPAWTIASGRSHATCPTKKGRDHGNYSDRAVGYYGTYSVGEGDKSLVYRVEGSTYPNFEGSEQKATITVIKGDDLTYVRAPIPSPQGPFVPTLAWKRTK